MAKVLDPEQTFWAHYNRGKRVGAIGNHWLFFSEIGFYSRERFYGIINQAGTNP